MLLQALFDFFYPLFNGFEGLPTEFGIDEFYFELFGMQTSLVDYLTIICSLFSLIFIIVLCCLFIYRLIRLVGRLFSGGAL